MSWVKVSIAGIKHHAERTCEGNGAYISPLLHQVRAEMQVEAVGNSAYWLAQPAFLKHLETTCPG